MRIALSFLLLRARCSGWLTVDVDVLRERVALGLVLVATPVLMTVIGVVGLVVAGRGR